MLKIVPVCQKTNHLNDAVLANSLTPLPTDHVGSYRITSELDKRRASSRAVCSSFLCSCEQSEHTRILIWPPGIRLLVWSLCPFMHQNVGHLCIRESGWVYEKVHEEGPETEKIPGLLSVSHPDRSSWAFTAAAAQRYGKDDGVHRLKQDVRMTCVLCPLLEPQQ